MEAMEACLSTEGVARMTVLASDILAENLFGKDNPYNGIRLSGDRSSMVIDVFLEVIFGCSIPQTAWDLQERVKKRVEKIGDIKVNKVNIHIEGVDLNGDA